MRYSLLSYLVVKGLLGNTSSFHYPLPNTPSSVPQTKYPYSRCTTFYLSCSISLSVSLSVSRNSCHCCIMLRQFFSKETSLMTAIIRSRGADVYYFVTHFLRNE